MKLKTTTLTAAMILASLAGTASGTTWYVDDNGPGDFWPNNCNLSDSQENGTQLHPFDSIEEAVAAAADGDTIVIRRGLYEGECTLNFVIDKDLTLRGLGECETILDGGGVRRAFSIAPGAQVRIENLSFRNCFSGVVATASGGAVFASSADVTFVDCCFKNCTTNNDGGAVAVLGGSGAYEGCVFENCSADDEGGAIAQLGGTLAITSSATPHDCSFDLNHARRGGAIRSSDTTTISNAFFIRNSAEDDGGVMLFESGADVTISNCEIGSVGPFDNTAGTNGGTISANDATIVIQDSTILNSTSGSLGGIIYMSGGSDVSIDASTLRYGTGTLGGGAIYNDASTLTITNSSLLDNTSGEWRGGAIRNASGATCDVTLTAFSDNIAGREGGAIYTQASVAHVTGCSFDRNKSETEGGGALRYETGASGLVDTCTFDGNTAFLDGGAISSSGGSTIEVLASDFSMNTANTDGGAISCYEGSSLSVVESDFSENIADTGRGGAISAIDAVGDVLVNGCSFTSNKAPNGTGASGSGGAIASISCDLSVQGGSFTTNEAIANGGAIVSEGGRVFVAASPVYGNPFFTGNVAWFTGGGLSAINSLDVTIEDAHFNDNLVLSPTATGGGAFVKMADGDTHTMTMRRTTLRSNSASTGAGLATSDSKVRIEECQIRENVASGGGGGALHFSSVGGWVEYRWTRFVDNSASGANGGGALLFQDTRFHNCGFFNNNSSNAGGAIASGVSESQFTLEVVGSLFTCNSAQNGGGAIHASHGGTSGAINSTFSRNEVTSATGTGGGILIDTGTVFDVHNSIFWENTDGSGNTFPAQIYLVSGTVTPNNSCFTDPACPPPYLLRPPYGTGPGTNICADPLFVDPDGADNMCGTEDDDLRLTAGSACIDAACNIAVPYDILDVDFELDYAELLPLDVVGSNRFVDDLCTADYSAGCEHPTFPDLPVIDMGAIEFPSCKDTCPADFDGDGFINGLDFDLYVQAFEGGDAGADFDGDGFITGLDFDFYVQAFEAGC